jgi:hypothetical protein
VRVKRDVMAIRVEPGHRTNPQNVMRGYQRAGVMGSRSAHFSRASGHLHRANRPDTAMDGPTLRDELRFS